LLRGSELLIRDLNSTNGTFINGEKISEIVLKPGQTLRFGQVELRIDDGTPVSAPPAPAPVPAAAPAPAPAPASAAKKPVEATMVIPRGVSLTDLEHSGTRPASFETSAVFSKKTNKVNKYFIIAGIIAGLLIVGLIIFALKQAGGSDAH
jgi:hypothetical protein